MDKGSKGTIGGHLALSRVHEGVVLYASPGQGQHGLYAFLLLALLVAAPVAVTAVGYGEEF